MKTDPDEPTVDLPDNDPAWDATCPKCNAKPGDECTSLVTGCCIDQIHAERRANVKTILCVECRATFTNAEFATAYVCPSCGTQGIPADLTKKHTITLTDHEWRILFIWADNWGRKARKAADDGGTTGKVIRAITAEVLRQNPDMPPLSLYSEMKGVADQLGVPCTLMEPGEDNVVIMPARRH